MSTETAPRVLHFSPFLDDWTMVLIIKSTGFNERTYVTNNTVRIE